MADYLSRFFFLLAGVSSAALVFTIYRLSIWCNRQQTATPPPSYLPMPQQLGTHLISEQDAAPNLGIHFIPVHKYHKDMGMVGDDGMCAVCLSEFEEGEELRTLPDCMHSFHVPCIDMWLYSHTNCHLCRTPSSLMLSDMQKDL